MLSNIHKIIAVVFVFVLVTSAAYAELKLESVYPTLGELGKDLQVTLKGTGFDENTRVSMYPDIGNKRSIIGSADTPGEAHGVTVIGGTAYVADGDSGLQVIDVSTPSQPVIIGSADTPGTAYGVTVIGGTAYVADGYSGLQVIDVSTPSQPVIIGSADTPGEAEGVAVIGGTAYVADDESGLQIIDVSTPSQPKIIGSADTPGDAVGVTVTGGTAYVADWYSGLQVIDVSTPSQPVIIGSADTPGYALGVTVTGGTAYVAGGGSGLKVIDVSTPSLPVITGSADTPSIAEGVTVIGGTAYVADGYSGLQVTDVSTPSQPVIIGSADTPCKAWGVTVIGGTAYVADEDSGLQIIDVSTPSQPVIIGSADTPGYALGVTVIGGTAYVADVDSLQVIDVSTPSWPLFIGSADTPGTAWGVTVTGGTAYVADGRSGLQVIDVSTPSQPVIIGSADTPGDARGVTVIGGTAYVADEDSGLQVIDVSTPSQPVIIGSADTPGYALGVTVTGGTAYVADVDSLQVIDVSTPSQPVIIGSADTPGSAHGVTVIGGTAYVADGNGLVTIPLNAITEIAPVTVNSETSITVTLPSPIAAVNWTLRVFNNNEYDELTGAVTFSEPDVYETERQKKAVLVAGRKSSDDWLWQFTEKAANYAYLTLLWQGYTRENVLYLSPNLDTDIDGDGSLNDTDQKASNSNLEQTLTSWAKDASELIVFMTSHGGKGTFWMNEEEILRAEELDRWLDTLQGTMPGKVIFIYDGCMSGSFIPLLKPPAGKERVLITSSAADEPAIFGKNGVLSFSYQFWASAYLEGNLWRAFDTAKEMMRGIQIAHLDANADGTAYVAMGQTWDTDSEDKYLIKDISVGRGHASASSPPVIGTVSGEQTLNGSTSASFSVSDIIGVNPVIKIWAQIVPPGNISPDTPLTDLPETELTDPDGDGTYEGTYSGFDMNGTYTVSIYAEDAEGFYSPPALTSVIQTGMAETKADLDGDEKLTLKDAVAALKLLGGEPVSFPVSLSDADVNNDKHIGLAELVYILRRLSN